MCLTTYKFGAFARILQPIELANCPNMITAFFTCNLGSSMLSSLENLNESDSKPSLFSFNSVKRRSRMPCGWRSTPVQLTSTRYHAQSFSWPYCQECCTPDPLRKSWLDMWTSVPGTVVSEEAHHLLVPMADAHPWIHRPRVSPVIKKTSKNHLTCQMTRQT